MQACPGLIPKPQLSCGLGMRLDLPLLGRSFVGDILSPNALMTSALLVVGGERTPLT